MARLVEVLDCEGSAHSGEAVEKAMGMEGWDFIDHEGATFRRRRGEVSWAVDDVFANGRWSPYAGDALKVGTYGVRLKGDPTGGGGGEDEEVEPPIR